MNKENLNKTRNQKQYQAMLNRSFLQALHSKYIYLNDDKEDAFFVKQLSLFNTLTVAGNVVGILGIYFLDKKVLALKYGQDNRGLMIRLMLGLSAITVTSVFSPKIVVRFTDFESAYNQVSQKYENVLLQVNPGLYQMKYGVLPIQQQGYNIGQPPYQQQQWQQPYQHPSIQSQGGQLNQNYSAQQLPNDQHYQSYQNQNLQYQQQGYQNSGNQQEFQQNPQSQSPPQYYSQNPTQERYIQASQQVTGLPIQQKPVYPSIGNQYQQQRQNQASQMYPGDYQQPTDQERYPESRQEESLDMTRNSENNRTKGNENFGYLKPSSK